MIDGIFNNSTEVYFGSSVFNKIVDAIKPYGRNLLLVTGGSSYRLSGAKVVIEQQLLDSEFKLTYLSNIHPDPVSDFVYKGAELAKINKVDLILAVGGGSVIDTAKAIGVAALDNGDFFDFFTRRRAPRASLPVGCVLTLSGSGSESSDGCVIQKGAQKYSCGAPFMRPKFAFINAELMQSVPLNLLRYGIADSLSHVLERFFTNVSNVSTSSRLCIGLIRSLVSVGNNVLLSPHDLSLRSDLVWAQKLAHDDTVGFGRKGDWATHTLAHEVAVITGRPHGEILSILFPAWLRLLKSEGAEMFNLLDEELVSDKGEFNGADAVELLVRVYEDLCPDNRTLSSLGVKSNDLQTIVERASKTTVSGTIGNYKRLDKEDMLSILRLAL